MVGPCSSCGPYTQYCGHNQGNSFSSMFWPMQYQKTTSSYDDENDYMYSSYASSSSPSVDCTLSLGTPSTRLSNAENTYEKPTPHRNSVSSFCWDLLHPKQSSNSSSKSHRNSNGNTGNCTNGETLARRCANCDTTSTPLWRNGPRGPKSLCNACGIRFKKEERRAAAASNTGANHGASAVMMDPHNGYYNGSWAHGYSQATPQKMQCFGAPNEFRFIEEDRGSDNAPGIQFLSWLTHDRPSGLVHDFTR